MVKHRKHRTGLPAEHQALRDELFSEDGLRGGLPMRTSHDDDISLLLKRKDGAGPDEIRNLRAKIISAYLTKIESVAMKGSCDLSAWIEVTQYLRASLDEAEKICESKVQSKMQKEASNVRK